MQRLKVDIIDTGKVEPAIALSLVARSISSHNFKRTFNGQSSILDPPASWQWGGSVGALMPIAQPFTSWKSAVRFIYPVAAKNHTNSPCSLLRYRNLAA